MPQVAYKFRCYPTRTQQALLTRFFGAKRFVWNRCLDWRSEAYRQDGESVTAVDFSRELTWLKTLEPYQWLREIPSTLMIQGLRDLDGAFKKFFKEGAGYPRHKKRHHHQSIRFQLDQRTVVNNYRAGELLKLTGLGKLKVRWSRVPPGIPKMVTLSLDAAGRYFVSMAIETTMDALPFAGKTVGIDLGINHLMVLSDGQKIDNPRILTKYAEQLKKLQQRLARQKKGSNRRKRTRQRIARLHVRIADARRDHLHRLTTSIVRDNQVIVIEDLNVKGMSTSSSGTKEKPGRRIRQKAGLNRAINDASFGEAARQITYKAGWFGRTRLSVDRFFPSSKTCSCCGHKVDTMPLDVRQWTCPDCGSTHDRDINAAINIEIEGLKQLTPGGTGEVRRSWRRGGSPRVRVTANPNDPNPCQERG